MAGEKRRVVVSGNYEEDESRGGRQVAAPLNR